MTEPSLDNILKKYQNSFIQKTYSEENNSSDILMDVFSLSAEVKQENKQYWGRELGMCWQLLIAEILRQEGYEPILLILREDNLPAAIKACEVGTWKIYTGDKSFNFIKEISDFDLKQFLIERKGEFSVQR